MARILIVYGTTDGHTARIANAMADTLRAEGSEVAVRTGAALTDTRPERYDGVIVAASVHVQAYQRSVRRWVLRHHAALNRRPSAFLSVCLAVLEKNPESVTRARTIMDQFLARTGWRPTIQKMVAGALPYTRYGWLKRFVMKRIARKAGGGTDTSRDYDYTDWNEVRDTARSIASLARGPEGARSDALTTSEQIPIP